MNILHVLMMGVYWNYLFLGLCMSIDIVALKTDHIFKHICTVYNGNVLLDVVVASITIS